MPKGPIYAVLHKVSIYNVFPCGCPFFRESECSVRLKLTDAAVENVTDTSELLRLHRF